MYYAIIILHYFKDIKLCIVHVHVCIQYVHVCTLKQYLQVCLDHIQIWIADHTSHLG